VRRLSTRVSVFSGLLVALLLGVFATSVLLYNREGMEEQLAKDLARESGSLLARMGSELESHPDGIPAPFVQNLMRSLEATGSLAQVIAPDGSEMFASPAFPTSIEGYQWRKETLSVGSAGVYTLELARATGSFRERELKLAFFFALFIPIGIAISALLSQLAIRRTLAPIEAVRLQAEQISRTNLSERIPEMGSSLELQDLVRTFNAMLGRMEKAIVDLDSFAADAAHELRTPLATLRAEIETAIQGNPSPQDYDEILASFQIEVSRMSHVVSDLFTLAKLDMHQHALQKERVQLGPLLEESRETWQPMASLRNILIELEAGDAEVMGDPTALRRVFMNLVENAVKYNREGGHVRMRLERQNGHVHVEVRDTGQGIAAEHLPKLFRRFYRADQGRSRESGGAGLGLAICKSFVESHQGKISVSSSPGQGSTFRVELPTGQP
jgi:heavy metal sensor kinase